MANPIADRVFAEDAAFTFTLPTNVFTDPDNDPLTITVAGLPTGTSFANGVISGTVAEPGTSPITVTANDGKGGITSTSFDLTISSSDRRKPARQWLARAADTHARAVHGG